MCPRYILIGFEIHLDCLWDGFVKQRAESEFNLCPCPLCYIPNVSQNAIRTCPRCVWDIPCWTHLNLTLCLTLTICVNNIIADTFITLKELRCFKLMIILVCKQVWHCVRVVLYLVLMFRVPFYISHYPTYLSIDVFWSAKFVVTWIYTAHLFSRLKSVIDQWFGWTESIHCIQSLFLILIATRLDHYNYRNNKIP